MNRIDLIYNPVAGSFRESRLRAIAEELGRAGFSVTVMPTQADGVRFSGSADLLVIHGGDGTVRDTVKALGNAAGETPLAIAPSGTINLVARELGYSPAPATFARRLAKAWSRGEGSWTRSPLFRLGDIPIVSCLSIGPDSRAVAQVTGALKRRMGRYAYVAALLRQMRDWPREPFSISGELASGEPFECQAEAVIVSHAALYAGPFRFSPEAALDRNSLELITLGESTRLRTMRMSSAAMLGLSLEKRGLADIRSCRRIRFAQCETPVQIDGDHMPGCARTIEPSGIVLRYVT